MRKKIKDEEIVSPWVETKYYTEWINEDPDGNPFLERTTVEDGDIDVREITHIFDFRSEMGHTVEGVHYVHTRSGQVLPIMADRGDLYRWRQVGDIMRRNEK